MGRHVFVPPNLGLALQDFNIILGMYVSALGHRWIAGLWPACSRNTYPAERGRDVRGPAYFPFHPLNPLNPLSLSPRRRDNA